MPTFNAVNQQGAPPELAQFLAPSEDPLDALTKLAVIYEYGDTFSYDFKVFDVDPTTELLAECEIELINYSCSISGFSAQALSEKVLKISGVASNVFVDGYYKFLMSDDSVQILPPTTTGYKALLEWSPPGQKIATINHTIKVNVSCPTIPSYQEAEHTFVLPQEVHWKWQIALAKFQELVAGGTI